MEKTEHLIEQLLILRSTARKNSWGGITDENDGICLNIAKYGHDDIHQYFTTWERYSGEIEFPVPSTIEGVSPEAIYMQTNSVWEGAYGDLRKNLLDHIINELIKELK
jgi:hypothetical protein